MPEVAEHITAPEEDMDSTPAFGPRIAEEREQKEVCMDMMDSKAIKETRPPKPYRPRAWGDIRERSAAVDKPWVTIFNPSYPAPKWETLSTGDIQFFGVNAFGMACQSPTYGEGVKRVCLRDTLANLGLEIPTTSPICSS